MSCVHSSSSHRAFGRGAMTIAVMLLAGCRSEEHAPSIPVGRSDAELLVVTRTLEVAFAEAPMRAVVRSEKDDGATGWEHRFEEEVDTPDKDVSKRRFRITIANRSEQVRTIRADLDYLTPGTRELLRTRTFRLIVVPPFTEKAISGYTQFRADRSVIAELRAIEVQAE